MNPKISFSLLLCVLFLMVSPVVTFAEINYVKVVNDTKQKRLISVHGKRKTPTKQEVSVDYKERRFDPETYWEFELSKGSTIVHISIENESGEYLEYPISKNGVYTVSNLMKSEVEDWDYLSW